MKYRNVESMADNLCQKMGNVGNKRSFKLYCRAFWELTEAEVANYVEQAQRGDNEQAYLNWLLNNRLNGKI